MKSIKSITTAGLCLVAMLVVSMVAAGSASAAPHWLVCLPEHENTTTTKWESHQCKIAKEHGGWEWSELKGTEAAVGRASLSLSDTVLGTTVLVDCTGELKGSVGPGKYDRVTEVPEASIHCVAGENCEDLEEAARPVDLPWQTELFETENTIRDRLSSGGNGAPGWKVKCKVPILGPTADTCTSEEGSTLQENKVTKGVEGELLVLGDFESKTRNAKCTVTKEETGKVRGTVALLLANGWALAVSK
jgi:hypothetical protein